MSEPVKVEKRLLSGWEVHVSLSHQGILAICACSDRYYFVQLTNLNDNRQVEMAVQHRTSVGFYDGMILFLDTCMPLREATVNEIFENPTINILKIIEGTTDVNSDADVSSLNVKRELCYHAWDTLFSFNVDTRMNTRIGVVENIRSIASFTGIACGLKAVFYACEEEKNNIYEEEEEEEYYCYHYCTYTLNMDNTITKLSERQDYGLTILFPLASNPENINNAIFKYCDLMKYGNKIDISHLIRFGNYSVIRVYRDIFLVYEWNIESWVLVRIVVP